MFQRVKLLSLFPHALFFLVLSMHSPAFGRDYIIYSVAQDIPMGNPGEVLKKNFYLNLGKNQGVKKGDKVDVFRAISQLDPYHSNTRYLYRMKIGELMILHSEDEAAIGSLSALNKAEDAPYYDVEGFMIGDQVKVQTGN